VTMKFKLGDRSVDADACEISHNGTIIKLTPRAMAVLGHLATRSGEVVTLEELLRDHWPRSVTSPNAVHKIAAELRHAFGENAALIETIPKRGYRLLAPIMPVETSNGAGPSKEATTANGESHHEEEPAVGRDARTVVRTSRVWIACGFLALLGAASFALFLTKNIEGTVIQIGERSAVLLTDPSSRSTEQDQRDLDTIRDQVVARFQSAGIAGVTPLRRFSSHPRHTDYAVKIELADVGDHSHASLSIAASRSGDLSHSEQFDRPTTDRLTLLDELASHTAEDLTVLLDKDRVAQMREWGATSVDAYRLAREGDAYQMIQTMESQNHAADRFRLAIRDDPTFKYAYLSLMSIYETLFVTPTDTANREQLRRAMQELAREARAASVDPDTQTWLDHRYKEMSAGNAYDAEEQWRTEITKNPRSYEAFNRYGRLLIGAKLYAEAQRYLDRCFALAREAGATGWVEHTPENEANWAEAQGDFGTAIRRNKRTLDQYPDGTANLFGLVRQLAKVGRYAEAEAYLTRLQRTNEMWGYGASVWLSTLRGDIRVGSPELEKTFAQPLMTNATRGAVCFMLGNVECGVRYWRIMESGYLPIYWEFGPDNEIYWAPGVLKDPRYRKLVNELGWGSEWRAYMRMKATELTPLTGIEVTSPPPPEDLSISEL
jgi:DNA-binding winged helix-turn-helix (wHTH) protein/Tfp pilus assembly protein PilF